jgi:glycerol-3-phosphate dehydrogenase
VAGGKLTTYRLIAEETVDQIVRTLGGSFNHCATADRPLLPSDKIEGISQIVPPPFSRELVEHFCDNEWARHLDDVMMRRSSWHFYDGPDLARAEQCAGWMAERLGWTPGDAQSELARYSEASDLPLRRPSGGRPQNTEFLYA